MTTQLWLRITWSRGLFVLFVLNLIWTASLFIAPFTISPGTFAYQVGAANLMDHWNIWRNLWIYPQAVYAFGDIQCHQLWYRSFWLNGNQLPIDARMTSMYIFANFGLLAAALTKPSTSASRIMIDAMPRWVRSRLVRFKPETAAFLLLVLFLVPTAVDGFYQLFSSVTHYESTNLMRVLTGAPGGFIGGLLVGAMLMSIRQFAEEIRAVRARLAQTGR